MRAAAPALPAPKRHRRRIRGPFGQGSRLWLVQKIVEWSLALGREGCDRLAERVRLADDPADLLPRLARLELERRARLEA
ncbi:MAG: hypothetical protein L6Q76_17220 [Polyangiaceae bacterium]|nr:hypothetical protein [Polyangiaceae bacterium]